MKQAIKAMGYGSHQSSARVVDGKLILSFPHALTPVVWQMDLSQAKASALEVREKDANTHVLVLKTPKGEAMDVAPFEKRAQAVEALMAVSRALENAQGQIRPAGDGETVVYRSAGNPKSKGRWLAIILAAVMFFILFGIWGSMLPKAPNGTALNPVSQGDFSGGDANGAPVDADAFLTRNR